MKLGSVGSCRWEFGGWDVARTVWSRFQSMVRALGFYFSFDLLREEAREVAAAVKVPGSASGNNYILLTLEKHGAHPMSL